MPAPSPDQLAASDPAVSAWVAANAGSGKTTVLVARVIRLLLAGADPSRILCVTFTKAAAANMQDRIFSRLGAWVALDDAALQEELAELDGAPADPARLQEARRLFARAVETPGGLKIQTIHSLCERLLHQFPFEAAVPARFEMLDETASALAMDRAVLGTMRAALADPASALGAAQRVVADTVGEDSAREALQTFITHRRGMERATRERGEGPSALRRALGVAAGETAEIVSRRFFTAGLPTRNIGEVCDWLATGSKTDRERGADLKTARGLQGGEDLALYLQAFLTGKGEPRKALATGALVKARPDLHEALVEEQERVVALQDRLKAAAAAERTEAIVLLADAVLARYEAEKRRLGRLDFHDLIAKAKALLTADSARWVLYKLDQGVDHILVDEAQDTSPDQWAVIKALSDDFFTGEGARGPLARTIFAVGDEKQSIFGFQGARPEEFDHAKRHYQGRIKARNDAAEAPHAFRDVRLQISYRSTHDILSAVDQVFALPEHYTGLESEARPTVHETKRTGHPGLVELWPAEEPAPQEDKDPDAPVDAQAPDAPPARLAARIALRIRHWMETGARFEADGKPVTPGDVLVLVRSRGPVFDSVIKALKKEGVPVAGADRMKLTEQLAVMDLLALGRFCRLPEDDLALAVVLKSPIVGLTEEELFALAHGRENTSLWTALQAKAGENTAFAAAAAILERLRQAAAADDPLRFYGEALAAGGLRRKLVQRLGSDAAEALDVFLYRLRQWQAANPPSLLLFLEAMAGDDSDVKRDMEEAHGRVRVMTVHGSKGLEAPVVFLADLFKTPGGGKGPRLVELSPEDPETAVWTPRKAEDPAALAEGRMRAEALEAAEHRRLLYVGLTRAKDRLYLASAMPGRAGSGHWQGMIEEALGGHASLRTAPDEAGEGEVRQWRTVSASPAPPAELKPPPSAPAIFPWLHLPAGADLPRPPPIRPSRLADAAEPPPLRDNAARRSLQRQRGDLIHLLLQHLPDVPAARREAAGAAMAAARYGGLDDALRAEALDSILRLLADPRWAALFGPDARAEAEIAGKVRIGTEEVDVAGRIDRLVIAPAEVTVVDYKTGRAPHDPQAVPESHLRQLAVYRALAQDLYPDRKVTAAVIWTAVPAIAVLPDAALDAALARLSAATAPVTTSLPPAADA